MLYISAWGFALLVLLRWARGKASEREASDSAGLHAFFMSLHNLMYNLGYWSPTLQRLCYIVSTKFFNNGLGNTLFDKLKGIASEMATFDRFLAVVGFFRSSGYFKLRKELGDISEIKILVGINIDDIFRKHNKALLMLADEDKAKEIYHNGFKEDIVNAQYSPEVEEGILQMCEDLVSGRLQMRIHAPKNLHAKFYLCLPQNHGEHSDGWVIMGSSNISDSGLGIKQPPQYELNVAMKDFDDVKYCSDEFWTLWNEAITLTAEDIEEYKKKTYLGYQPTPYELYIKVLIDTFGDQVEDDFSIQLPDGIKDLKYQKDAVIQGYQMLMQHNGLFILRNRCLFNLVRCLFNDFFI